MRPAPGDCVTRVVHRGRRDRAEARESADPEPDESEEQDKAEQFDR